MQIPFKYCIVDVNNKFELIEVETKILFRGIQNTKKVYVNNSSKIGLHLKDYNIKRNIRFNDQI